MSKTLIRLTTASLLLTCLSSCGLLRSLGRTASNTVNSVTRTLR